MICCWECAARAPLGPANWVPHWGSCHPGCLCLVTEFATERHYALHKGEIAACLEGLHQQNYTVQQAPQEQTQLPFAVLTWSVHLTADVVHPWVMLSLLLCCRVTLMKPWTPGQHGAPEASLNTDAFCDELNVSGASPANAPCIPLNVGLVAKHQQQ